MTQATRRDEAREEELRALRQRVADLEARLGELVGPEALPLDAQLKHLEQVISRMPAVLWTTDRKLRYLSSHGSGLELLGLSENEVRGTSLFDYYRNDDGAPEDDGSGLLPIDSHRKALEGGTASYEQRWKGRLWRSFVEPLRDRAGKVIGTIGVALDVTETEPGAAKEQGAGTKPAADTERSTDQGQEVAKRFHHFYEQSPAMMYSIDESGLVREANTAWLDQLGYAREEVLGREVAEFMAEESAERARGAVIPRFFLDGSARDISYQFVRRSGSVMDVLVDSVVVEDPSGEPLSLSVVRDVTEWKRSDEERRRVQADLELKVQERTAALRETNRRLSVEIHERKQGEDRFRRLVEGLSEHIIYSHGLDGTISYMSPSATQILGFSLDRLVDHFTSYMTEHPANRAALRHNDLTVEGHPQPPYEAEFFHKDGTRRWLEISESPVFDDGRVIAVEGIARDITQRKEADDALRESETRFRQIAESIDGVFYITDPTNRATLYVSPGFRMIWQREPQDVYRSARTWLEAIHPDDRERVVAAAREKRAVGEYDEQYRILRPDGTTRWIHDRAFPIENESGRIYRIAGLAEDITALKDVEEALRQSGARLRGIVETVLDAIITVDDHGIIWSFNPAASRIFGFEEREAVGQSTALLFPDTLKERLGSLLEWYFAEGEGEVREGIARRKDGTTFPCELAVTRLEVAGNRMLTAVVRDLTARKRGEEALLAASRMDATSTLAAGVAHDFNNLMAVIQTNTDLLRQMVEGDGESVELVREIAGIAQKGGDLARQLLLFSRGGKSKREIVDPNRILLDILGFQARVFPPSISLERDLGDDVPLLEADPTQLGQVVLNLVTNAREAIEAKGEGGGRVRVSTRLCELDAAAVAGRSDLVPGPTVLLSVEDDGAGMDADTQARIFEPFYTTKFHGRGLGLAATFGIVRNHAGHIEVESRPGQGTRFDLYLPVPC